MHRAKIILSYLYGSRQRLSSWRLGNVSSTTNSLHGINLLIDYGSNDFLSSTLVKRYINQKENQQMQQIKITLYW